MAKDKDPPAPPAGGDGRTEEFRKFLKGKILTIPFDELRMDFNERFGTAFGEDGFLAVVNTVPGGRPRELLTREVLDFLTVICKEGNPVTLAGLGRMLIIAFGDRFDMDKKTFGKWIRPLVHPGFLKRSHLWTAEEVEYLLPLLEGTDSFAALAKRLGRRFKCTFSAEQIRTKARRLGLPGRRPPA
jgi:hypothetical protein